MNAAVQSRRRSNRAPPARPVSWFRQPQIQLFRAQGPQATHYEDMTVDVQPDPERYLLQDWIISFPDGNAAYSENWTQRRARTGISSAPSIRNGSAPTISASRRSAAWCRASSTTPAGPARPRRFDKAWVKILQNIWAPGSMRSSAWARRLMQAQRYGYTQMINNAILTNSSYKLRLRPGHHALPRRDRPGPATASTTSPARRHWLEDPIWQGTREAIEAIMGATDYPGAVFRDQHRVRAAGRRIVPQRLHHAGRRLAETTSSRRR